MTISLTSLSTLFSVERSYLSKAFKQVTGCNLMLAIAKKRIEKAAEYIRQRDLSLTEIGYLVGYEEYAYFNRVFHKIMGVSPSEFKAHVFEEEAPDEDAARRRQRVGVLPPVFGLFAAPKEARRAGSDETRPRKVCSRSWRASRPPTRESKR